MRRATRKRAIDLFVVDGDGEIVEHSTGRDEIERIASDIADTLVLDAPTALRTVGMRVDWYGVGYFVTFSKEAKRAIARAASTANGLREKSDNDGPSKRKGAPIEIGDVAGSLTPIGAKSYVVKSGLFKLTINLDDPHWNVTVELRALYLARLTFPAAIEASRVLARSLGAVGAERVRRLDLAVDVVGWRIDACDATAIMGRALRASGRGSVADFRPDVKDMDADNDNGEPMATRTFWAAQRVTGITVCAGGDLMCRVYDKSTELSLPERETKRECEELRWRGSPGGWNGERVTRIEFQLRSQALREFRDVFDGKPIPGTDDERSARNPDRLVAMLDSIFAYCTLTWARMVVPGTATRLSRCALDPRWLFLRAQRFDHEAAPGIRLRTRGGATVASTLGCARSLTAAPGLSFPIAMPDGLLANEKAARWFIARFVEAEMGAAATYAIALLLSKCRTADDVFAVASELVTAHNDTHARFAVGPLESPVVPQFMRQAMYEIDEWAGITDDAARSPLTYAELVKLLDRVGRDCLTPFVNVSAVDDVDDDAA